MSDWNPDKYLAFKNERALPAIDLVEKIAIDNPKKIIDIGCGPGNSTQVLVKRWPNSIVVGLDSSETMIEKAKADFPNQTWIHEKAENINDSEKYSIVFSNAALQWIDDHDKLIPKLWGIVDEKGAFAVQMPDFGKMPANAAINNVLNSRKTSIKNRYWNKRVYDLNFYYELLYKSAREIILWETHYYHILPSTQGIVDFLHTTALKPYLEQLDTEAEKQEFEKEILKELRNYYEEQSDGKVLFPFQRMFIIAYK
jgi:trans-aconitate 2-methyltransferase